MTNIKRQKNTKKELLDQKPNHQEEDTCTLNKKYHPEFQNIKTILEKL